MSVINTNVSATLASNAINRNDRAMTTAMERLSTGQRINSASDDAAGLAISTRMKAQVSGLEQAARNANDGISMLQVAEGAYVEVSNMLSRMKELAVQSASGTYSSTDRTALDLEFTQLRSELARVAGNTEWNGYNVLNGNAGGTGVTDVNFQVGASSGQTMTAAFNTLHTSTAVATSTDTTTDAVAADATNEQAFAVVITDAASTVAVGDKLAFTITDNSSNDVNIVINIDQDFIDQLAAGTPTPHAIVNADVDYIEGQAVKDLSKVLNGAGHGGIAVTVGADHAGAATQFTIQIEGDTVDEAFSIKGGNTGVTIVRGEVVALDSIDITTATNAGGAAAALDTIITNVSAGRAKYGAYINRLEHASDNLTNVAQNTDASRSRIEDADYAAETSELARTQIIAQAATAMLAQANQAKQSVLALLQ